MFGLCSERGVDDDWKDFCLTKMKRVEGMNYTHCLGWLVLIDAVVRWMSKNMMFTKEEGATFEISNLALSITWYQFSCTFN